MLSYVGGGVQFFDRLIRQAFSGRQTDRQAGRQADKMESSEFFVNVPLKGIHFFYKNQVYKNSEPRIYVNRES